MTKNKKTTYWAEIIINNNKVKIGKSNRLTALNQYKMTWQPYNSRDLARQINNSNLVIK